MNIPVFRYHPDPLATGSIRQSDVVCVCCEIARGYIYTAAVYAAGSYRDRICPWCIADGSAAEKLKAMFSCYLSLAEAGVPNAVIEEVTRRTPGFNSWQQENWLTCCGDACEFHGDAPRSELQALQGSTLARTLASWNWKEGNWMKFIEHYQPGGNPAVYKFRCRHCGDTAYAVDFT